MPQGNNWGPHTFSIHSTLFTVDLGPTIQPFSRDLSQLFRASRVSPEPPNTAAAGSVGGGTANNVRRRRERGKGDEVLGKDQTLKWSQRRGALPLHAFIKRPAASQLLPSCFSVQILSPPLSEEAPPLLHLKGPFLNRPLYRDFDT